MKQFLRSVVFVVAGVVCVFGPGVRAAEKPPEDYVKAMKDLATFLQTMTKPDAEKDFATATPFVPIVRVKSLEEGVARSLEAEHNYKHTSIIHSHDVEAMTAMGRALDTTLFIKNGPSMAGLGLGGEGYLSYSIATPTGEGVTNPRTFTRVRRCVMVDNLRIY